jgi:hypothetical protein
MKKQKPKYGSVVVGLRVDESAINIAREVCKKNGIDFNDWLRVKIGELSNEKHCPLCKKPIDN